MTLAAAVVVAVGLMPTDSYFRLTANQHPHDWIRSFKVPGKQMDCCGGADCVALQPGALAGKKVGDRMPLRAVGRYPAQDVTIRAIYPAPPGSIRGWGCFTGCFFVPLGF